MSSFLARPVNVVIFLVLMSAAALSAVAQGQTPTSPQQSTERRVRPAPSSGIPWDGDDSTTRRGEAANSDSTGEDRTTGTRRRSSSDSESSQTSERPSRSLNSTSSSEPASKEKDTKTPAEKAAADTGPGKEPPKAREAGGGPRTIGGKASAAAGTTGLPGAAAVPGAPGASGLLSPGTSGLAGGAAGAGFTQGGVSAVTVTGEGAFEPIKERKPEYKEVPEAGEKITLEGPMPLGEFLAAINMATNWNVVMSPVLEDVELRFWIFDVTPKQARKY